MTIEKDLYDKSYRSLIWRLKTALHVIFSESYSLRDYIIPDDSVYVKFNYQIIEKDILSFLLFYSSYQQISIH